MVWKTIVFTISPYPRKLLPLYLGVFFIYKKSPHKPTFRGSASFDTNPTFLQPVGPKSHGMPAYKVIIIGYTAAFVARRHIHYTIKKQPVKAVFLLIRPD